MESAAILRRIKRQLFAYKISDVFTSSPVVAVYQGLGATDIKLLEESLAKKVKDLVPESDYAVVSLTCRNKLVNLASNNEISKYIQGQNLIVGFKTRASIEEQAKNPIRIKHSDSIVPMLASLNPDVLSRRPSLPHKSLAALMSATLNAPSQLKSLIPIALFYNGTPIPLKAADSWTKLDERQVFFELLSQIEGPASSVVDQVDDAAVGGLADVLAALSELNEGIAAAADFKAKGAEDTAADKTASV